MEGGCGKRKNTTGLTEKHQERVEKNRESAAAHKEHGAVAKRKDARMVEPALFF